jgi:hypothetical protein
LKYLYGTYKDGDTPLILALKQSSDRHDTIAVELLQHDLDYDLANIVYMCIYIKFWSYFQENLS